jgi:ABC-2 type transport system permease protein
MDKIFLIIKREYITRVKNKTFLLSTFLLPILLLLFIVGATFLAVKSRGQDRIAILNDPGYFKEYLKSDSSFVIFDFPEGIHSENYSEKGYSGLLKIQPEDATKKYVIESKKNLSRETMRYIERQMNKAIENHILQERGIDKRLLDSISRVSKESVSLSNKLEGGKEANSGLAYGVGFGSGIIIYITMFIFGAMVMRGVMEEKMNRIAEVMVSSVKPFQLMMGKIIGIAAVGLTQLLLWILFIIVMLSAVQLFIPAETVQQFQKLNDMQQAMPGGPDNTVALEIMKARTSFITEINWLLIIPCFIFYFLGGYLFYAALFAAVGSVINEDPQEAQSLMLPIMMPIIFGFIILSTSVERPDSPAAFWGSMIPFTSPIVMMGRVANGVPEAVAWWELFLSMALLVLGFIFTTWFAAKVYRTGILLYGKKVTLKEMVKWAFRKS